MNLFNNLSKAVNSKKEELSKENEEYRAILQPFQINGKQFSNYYFDLKNRKILQARTTFNRNYKIIDFDSVSSFDVNESIHDETVTKGKTKKKHGILRAATGGAIGAAINPLAGVAGAVVGSGTAKGKTKSHAITKGIIDHLGLIIRLNDGSHFEIVFIKSTTKADSRAAKKANQQLNELLSILNAGTSSADTVAANDDSLEQLKKLKELLDINAITEAEYNQKKKDLLDI